MVGVPALAGIVTVMVLLGPAQERPARGVRVRGTVTRASEVWALRVETLHHLGGLYGADPHQTVALSLWRDEREVSSWSGASDEAGLAEARLPLPPQHRGADEYQLRVSSERGVVARSQIRTSPPLPTITSAVHYRQPGNPSIEVYLPRGTLAPPFPEPAELQVHWYLPAGSHHHEPAPPAPEVQLKPLGGSVARGTPQPITCNQGGCDYRLPLTIRAQAPVVELEVTVTVAALSAHWSGVLSVHSSALWLDPSERKNHILHIRSAAPRQHAFVSLLASSGRIWGSIVALQTGDDGYASGNLSIPRVVSARTNAEALTLVLSNDAYEPASSASWPLPNKREMVQNPGLSLLADSMPLATRREVQRRARARRPAWGIVLAAGLFELFYLWRRNRLTRVALARHLNRQIEVDGHRIDALRGPRALGWLVLLSLALMALFAVLAGVAAFG